MSVIFFAENLKDPALGWILSIASRTQKLPKRS